MHTFEIPYDELPFPFVPPTCTILYEFWGFPISLHNLIILLNPGLKAFEPNL